MMQQTDKYKLNLIETSDAFSPNPLNENMEKVEGALTAVTAHADAGDAALDQRLQILEAHHIVAGTYTGDSSTDYGAQDIILGFTPKLVSIGTGTPIFMILGCQGSALSIIENGFRVQNTKNSRYNGNGGLYYFFAIG